MLPAFVNRVATWLCLVATLLLGAAPSRGLVLCVGADGHVALEASGADASCFDCPDANAAPTTCCAEANASDAGCNCIDTLLLASEKQPLRSLVNERTDEIPPACLVAHVDLDFAPAPGRAFELCDRSRLAPCPRVPKALVLRI